LLREFAGGAVGIESFVLGVDVMEFAGALRMVIGVGHADVGADEGPVLEIRGAEERPETSNCGSGMVGESGVEEERDSTKGRVARRAAIGRRRKARIGVPRNGEIVR